MSDPVRRLPATIDDDRLLGGLDLTATLAAGRPVYARGLLAEASGGTIVVPMAERIDAGLAGRLAAALDAGGITLVLLDEGSGDEVVPVALADRVAFRIDLDGLAERDRISAMPEPGRSVSGQVSLSDLHLEALCTTALVFGIDSPRATLLAVRVARAAAQLAGRNAVTDADIVTAARLVLMPRATRLPAPPDAAAPEPPPEPPRPDDGHEAEQSDTDTEVAALTDIVVDAVQAALPADVLAALGAGRTRNGTRTGAGARRTGMQRGRPLASRPGTPRGGQRLALVDTLRAAAPWQRLRRDGTSTRVVVRRDDLRIRRFASRAEATTIFAVDASGSAAIARLAETKGAVELLLAEAYVKRTEVALLAFRGSVATLVLPPTRSLARAKRCLADLAGGGGTPLAAGLTAAHDLARTARTRGRTPFVIVLTDGRANIANDGTASRERATADAKTAALAFAAERVAAALIDTAVRPRADGAMIAAATGARYAPLPAATAAAMAALVRGLEAAP